MKQYRIKINEALNWELYKTSLYFALADQAEDELNLWEEEGESVVTVEGEEFVVTFTPA